MRTPRSRSIASSDRCAPPVKVLKGFMLTARKRKHLHFEDASIEVDRSQHQARIADME